jgi:hypothetical protein
MYCSGPRYTETEFMTACKDPDLAWLRVGTWHMLASSQEHGVVGCKGGAEGILSHAVVLPLSDQSLRFNISTQGSYLLGCLPSQEYITWHKMHRSTPGAKYLIYACRRDCRCTSEVTACWVGVPEVGACALLNRPCIAPTGIDDVTALHQGTWPYCLQYLTLS